MAMRVHEPDGRLVAEAVELATPAAGWVRVEVRASGVCFADLGTSRAHDAHGPVTPGHEVAGVLAALGDGVDCFELGERVAVGWFGGSCGHCEPCRRSDVVHCSKRKIPGRSYPGGWAQSITVPADALARIPEALDFHHAAPMGCAGVTTFNAVRHAGIPAGGRIAVFGIGGLGHLAVQWAAKMGYEVIAIARGSERQTLAHELGAQRYIDSAANAPGAALAALGGADLIMCTASTTAPVTELLGGLRVRGRLVLIGVDEGRIEVPAAQLILKGQVVTGHLTGSAQDTEDAMRFAAVHGVRPMIERLPLHAANEAVERLSAGAARFRIVLDAGTG